MPKNCLKSLSLPVVIGGESYLIKGRLGISRFPLDSDDPDGLIQQAEDLIVQARQKDETYINPIDAEVNQSWNTPLPME